MSITAKDTARLKAKEIAVLLIEAWRAASEARQAPPPPKVRKRPGKNQRRRLRERETPAADE